MMPGEPLVPPPPYGNPPPIPQPYQDAPEGFWNRPGVQEELSRAGFTGGPDGMLRRAEELVQQDGFDAMRLASRYATDHPHPDYATPQRLAGSDTYSSSTQSWPETSWPVESESPYYDPNPPQTGSVGGGIFMLMLTAVFCIIPWRVYFGTATGDGIVHLFWVCWSLVAVPALFLGGGSGIYVICKAANPNSGS